MDATVANFLCEALKFIDLSLKHLLHVQNSARVPYIL